MQHFVPRPYIRAATGDQGTFGMTLSMDFETNASGLAVLDEPRPAPAPPAVAIRPRSSRYQSLDLWRGVACLMLVMYHATFYAEHSWNSRDPSTWTVGGLAINLLGRMWIGVPIFFVVSGYCIAASSDASRRKTHSLRTYFARRFRRIYPPLWIACGISVILALAAGTSTFLYQGINQLPHLGEFSFGNWIGNLTATESWRSNVSGGEIAYLMKNTWTLCYEEQFYAVVGLMLLVAGSRFFAAAGVVTLVTLAARHLSRAADTSLQGFFCDGHWLLFAIGIFVYYRLHYGRERFKWTMPVAMAVIVVYAAFDYRLTTSPFDKHLDEYLFTAALFGLLLTGLYRIDGHLANHPWLQPLAWYGKMSYSVYLTHFPVVVALGFVLSEIGTKADWFAAAVTVPLSIAISIPLGRAFHLSVERHFMNKPLDARKSTT
jgi:peptidoglycan/LPS O-acetylase OafA/YrhL